MRRDDMREHLFDDVEDIIGYILARNGYLGHSELHLILAELYHKYERLYGNDREYPKHLFERDSEGYLVVQLPEHKRDKYINKYVDNDEEFIYFVRKYFQENQEIEMLINVVTKDILERF